MSENKKPPITIVSVSTTLAHNPQPLEVLACICMFGQGAFQLGIRTVDLKTKDFADMWDLWKSMTDKEKSPWIAGIDAVFTALGELSGMFIGDGSLHQTVDIMDVIRSKPTEYSTETALFILLHQLCKDIAL